MARTAEPSGDGLQQSRCRSPIGRSAPIARAQQLDRANLRGAHIARALRPRAVEQMDLRVDDRDGCDARSATTAEPEQTINEALTRPVWMSHRLSPRAADPLSIPPRRSSMIDPPGHPVQLRSVDRNAQARSSRRGDVALGIRTVFQIHIGMIGRFWRHRKLEP